MKVLIIANHLLTPKISSGGDRIFVEMAKRWRKWGASLTVLAPKIAARTVAQELGAKEVVEAPSSPFDKLPQQAIWTIFPLYLHRTFKVLWLLKSVEADTLYTTGDFFCDVLPAFYLKKKLGIKWVANIYHINEQPFVRKGNGFLASTVSYVLQRFSFLFIKRSADVIFLNNKNVKDSLVKMGFEAKKLFVTGLGGIDLKNVKCQMSNVKLYEGCFLGRLNPTKGIFDLPKVWQRVVEKIPEARLVLIGGGEKWLDELQSQIQKLGLSENIEIAGFVSEEEKLKLLSQSKIFVFPSYEEGWGIAIAEAMAAGLPVVAYDLPSYREVFPDALVVVETGGVVAMSESVLNLLQNDVDYEFWQEKGYNVVQRYDLEKIAKIQWGIVKDLK